MGKNKYKSPFKKDIAETMSKDAGITLKQASMAIESFKNMIVENLNEVGEFFIPGICKISKKIKKGKPERTIYTRRYGVINAKKILDKEFIKFEIAVELKGLVPVRKRIEEE